MESIKKWVLARRIEETFWQRNPWRYNRSSMPGAEMLCVYQFKVVLRGISPMIWRRLLLRSDHSIADLHYTIQIAMGWSDSHLHRFHIHGKDYGVDVLR